MKGIKPVPINFAIMTDHKFFIKQFRAFSFHYTCMWVWLCVYLWGWWGGCNKIYMKGTKEEIVIITYINPQNFLYAIHMVQATYYFPDHCVQARTETPTRHNTSMNIVWLKIHLNNIEQQTSMTIIWFLISSIPMCKKHTKQTKTHTRWRGPARRKCVPLGLFLWTTICKSKDKTKIYEF